MPICSGHCSVRLGQGTAGGCQPSPRGFDQHPAPLRHSTPTPGGLRIESEPRTPGPLTFLFGTPGTVAGMRPAVPEQAHLSAAGQEAIPRERQETGDAWVGRAAFRLLSAFRREGGTHSSGAGNTDPAPQPAACTEKAPPPGETRAPQTGHDPALGCSQGLHASSHRAPSPWKQAEAELTIQSTPSPCPHRVGGRGQDHLGAEVILNALDRGTWCLYGRPLTC